MSRLILDANQSTPANSLPFRQPTERYTTARLAKRLRFSFRIPLRKQRNRFQHRHPCRSETRALLQSGRQLCPWKKQGVHPFSRRRVLKRISTGLVAVSAVSISQSPPL